MPPPTTTEDLINRLVALIPDSEFHGPPEFRNDVPAEKVSARFNRPDAQVFYTQFNPQMVVLEGFLGEMNLYDFASLDEQQDGYSVEGRDRTPVEDWPEGMLVIGDCGADPIMLDPSRPGEVLYALHGQGVWEPVAIADDIEGVLKLCIAWLETVRQRGEELFDDSGAYADASIELFEQLARELGISQQHLNNVFELA